MSKEMLRKDGDTMRLSVVDLELDPAGLVHPEFTYVDFRDDTQLL